MRTLYVHVGPMKTGTSSIQSALKAHDDSLILYPKIGLWGPGSHHDLVYAYFGQEERRPKGALPADELYRKIAAAARGTAADVLISSERLVASVRSPKAQRDVSSFVRTLLNAVKQGEEDWRIEILFACREHFERAASTYSQQVKGVFSTETRDPDTFLRQSIPALLYAPTLRMLRETGFSLAVLNYHPSDTWVQRFLRHVGFPEDRIPNSEARRNVSLSPRALIAKLAANRVLNSDRDRKEFTRRLQSMPGYYFPSQFIFGAKASADAELEFAADRDSVRREFGVALPSPDLHSSGSSFCVTEDDLRVISENTRSLPSCVDIVRTAREFM